MTRKENISNLINLFVGLVLALVMTFVIPVLLNGGFSQSTPESFLQDYISNLMMGFFVSTWLPFPLWGAKLASLAGAKEGMGLHLIQTAVCTVGMVVLMTVGQLFLKMGFSPAFPVIFARIILPLNLIAYPVLLVVTPMAAKLSKKLCTD